MIKDNNTEARSPAGRVIKLNSPVCEGGRSKETLRLKCYRLKRLNPSGQCSIERRGRGSKTLQSIEYRKRSVHGLTYPVSFSISLFFA